MTAATDLELAARHRYRLPNGEVAINVTTISDLVDGGKSAAMAAAAAGLTRQGRDYRQEWRDKADLGTRVHKVCEKWLLSQVADVPDEDLLVAPSDHGYIDALEKFWREYSPRVVVCEAITLSETHGYGGRFDMVIEVGPRRLLVDLKTGKPWPISHTWQLAAYRYADGIAEYDEKGRLDALRPLPEVDGCACLYLREDGSFRFPEYPADRTAFAKFCSLLDAYRWMHSQQMTRLVKEAREW
jgi:hypothetical protein